MLIINTWKQNIDELNIYEKLMKIHNYMNEYNECHMDKKTIRI
jgi:hypothetical protein